MASEYFIDHHCEYFFFCERCVNEIERKKATTNIAQPYQDGARGENLRPKIATMAAGRRPTAAPDGQTRRDSFFIANSAGKRTTTLLHEQQLNTRRPRRPRRRESARENRNDGSRAAGENDPGRAGRSRRAATEELLIDVFSLCLLLFLFVGCIQGVKNTWFLAILFAD